MGLLLRLRPANGGRGLRSRLQAAAAAAAATNYWLKGAASWRTQSGGLLLLFAGPKRRKSAEISGRPKVDHLGAS